MAAADPPGVLVVAARVTVLVVVDGIRPVVVVAAGDEIAVTVRVLDVPPQSASAALRPMQTTSRAQPRANLFDRQRGGKSLYVGGGMAIAASSWDRDDARSSNAARCAAGISFSQVRVARVSGRRDRSCLWR